MSQIFIAVQYRFIVSVFLYNPHRQPIGHFETTSVQFMMEKARTGSGFVYCIFCLVLFHSKKVTRNYLIAVIPGS